ncbi:MAG: two-component system response regulator LytT [Flavobacterium sp.]|jgi:two-component system response regulator LytT
MHVLILEDEPVIMARLVRQIGQILGKKLSKLKTFGNLDDAQEYIAEQSIDLLCLDLNLKGANGFDLLQSLTASSFHTIIISAHTDEAVKAFEYGVLDFVAKPFTLDRLQQAVNRVLDSSLRQDYGTRFLSVKNAGIIKLIEVSQIEYIMASGHYSELVISQQKQLHHKPIEKLLAVLPPNFERIHRSYIVNMNLAARISIKAGSNYELVMSGGTVLPIGRSRFNAIKEKLNS